MTHHLMHDLSNFLLLPSQVFFQVKIPRKKFFSKIAVYDDLYILQGKSHLNSKKKAFASAYTMAHL